MANRELRILDSFEEYLNNSNIRVTDRSRDLILFDKDDLHFIMVNESSDPSYFRLLLPKVEAINENNKNNINKKCLKVSTDIKVAKAVEVDDYIWLSVEMFITSVTSDIYYIFNRSIQILETMYHSYNQENATYE